MADTVSHFDSYLKDTGLEELGHPIGVFAVLLFEANVEKDSTIVLRCKNEILKLSDEVFEIVWEAAQAYVESLNAVVDYARCLFAMSQAA